MNRKLRCNLVEPPGQAQDDNDSGRKRVEWARGGGERGRGGQMRLGSDFGYAALQCAQIPEISMTGVLGTKPAAREALLIVSATAADAASPTAPHFSQIRKTTGSLLL